MQLPVINVTPCDQCNTLNSNQTKNPDTCVTHSAFSGALTFVNVPFIKDKDTAN
jgi:hypothetical protein